MSNIYYLNTVNWAVCATEKPLLNEIYVPVDEDMAWIIQTLNRKGYYTSNCCQGHWEPCEETTDLDNCPVIADSPYISFMESVSLPNLPDENYWTASKHEVLYENGKVVLCIPNENISAKDASVCDLNIKSGQFEKGVSIALYATCINENHVADFMYERHMAIAALIKWTNELPIRNEQKTKIQYIEDEQEAKKLFAEWTSKLPLDDDFGKEN